MASGGEELVHYCHHWMMMVAVWVLGQVIEQEIWIDLDLVVGEEIVSAMKDERSVCWEMMVHILIPAVGT